MALFRKKQRADDDAPVDPEARAPQTGVKYKDLFVMHALKEAGADLHQPREVRYFLSFADRAMAEAVATIAADSTFTPGLVEPERTDDGRWSLVLVRPDVVVDFDTVRDHDDFLTAVAADHDGTYDGWEAAAQP